MYIVAIAWIYVALMASITQPSVFRGVVTFVGTGVLPLALFLWLFGTPQRRRNRARDGARDAFGESQRTDAVTPPPGDSGKPDH